MEYLITLKQIGATALIFISGLLGLNQDFLTVGTAPRVLTVQQGGTGASTLTGCLEGNGTGAITGTGSNCGSGGGGGGGGTFSTTTSGVAGQLFNYPNNNDDIVLIGSNSSTTAEFYYDPNVFNLFVKSASSTIAGPLDVIGNFRLPLLSQGFAGIGSGGRLYNIASSSILLQDLGGAVTDAQVPDTITVNLAGTATALAGNGSNCSAGSFPLGVDASGAVESCTDAWTEAENTSAGYVAGTRTLTVAGTANQITSSAGAQDLSANRTWTLSIPSQFNIQQASTTNFSANWLKVGGTASTTLDNSGVTTEGNLSFNGEIMPDGSTCADGEILKKTGANNWDCAADSTGGGGGDFPFTVNAWGNSTTTRIGLLGGVNASSTSLFDNATSTLFTAVTGWFTNIFVGVDTLAEYISDTVGAMFSGNTETGVTVTYQDADNTVDVVCNTADTNTFGCLTDTDWDTFNNKQSAITFGTGVQTALGVNIGSAGAPVLFNGALGTPSSGTLALNTLSFTGDLNHEYGGLEADVSAYNGFPHIAGGVTTATTSPVFFERAFSNWASTTPNYNSQIYASAATSTLKIYLPRAVSFTGIGGSIRTGTSLLCEIGNGTASTTRLLTTTAGQTSDSVVLAGEVTVACGSGIGNPDDANFSVFGEYSR